MNDEDSIVKPLGMILVSVVIGVIIAVALSEPRPCSDYSFIMSRVPFQKHDASCDDWIDMTTTFERSIVHGTTVHCKCP